MTAIHYTGGQKVINLQIFSNLPLYWCYQEIELATKFEEFEKAYRDDHTKQVNYIYLLKITVVT